MDRKLIAAIMGAVSAYIELEQQPLSPTSRVKPQPKVNRWKISRRQELMKGKKRKH